MDGVALRIKRVAIVEQGAFGAMLWHGVPFALSLERTYENLSLKIDPGVYRCFRTFYFKGSYPTYEISVPGHTRILFHKGNVEEELEGCVAVGEEFGLLEGRRAVLRSGRGFGELVGLAAGVDSFNVRFENP